MDIHIKSLAPDLLEDFLTLFDNMVFVDNPDWSACYCYSFHFTGPAEDWIQENNRTAVIKLIREGGMKGYLAYSGGQVAGWCNANERENYQRLMKYYDLLDNPDDRAVSIVCFLIKPEFRRKGIARAMLDRICKDYIDLDYDYLEAYPLKGNQSCEKHYHGPISLYEEYGFDIRKELKEYIVVRKSLK